jgi:zinc-binding alcohol dehydrogenase/oxidoreductase
MRVLVLRELKTPLLLEDRPNLSPGEGEVVVRLAAAALNRRDYWITQGMYPGIKLPVVLGSDGAGVVESIGVGADEAWLGREVIINPAWEWGPSELAQAASLKVLGMPIDGTLATHVRVPVEYLHDRPGHLSVEAAAALPLAGVTAYRAAFTQGHIAAGEKVLVTGAGGGVSSIAIQFAVAAGAEVFVTSSSAEKIASAVKLGAKAGFDYKSADWPAKAKASCGAFDLIIDGAGGEGYAALIELAAPGGRIVNYGATAGPPAKLDLFKVFWKQLRLLGSTMGSPRDFSAMLDFVAEHKIRPVVDQVFALAEGNEAIARMRDTRQFGKIVVDVRG